MLPTGLSRALFAGMLMCAVLVPGVSAAQDFPPPPHIALVDGTATVTHEGEADTAVTNLPLVAGDTVETAAGRLEVLFADGSTLDLDEYSRLDVLSPTLFRLLQGRLLLTVAGVDDPSRAARFEVDTPVATAATDGPGEYRVDAVTYQEGPVTELAVLRGYGSLSTELGSVALGAGQRSIARDREAPSYPQAFNSARFDAFDQWTASIHGARTGGAAARQYLPSELQLYGRDFDRYGDWQYDGAYGYVWYPRVAVTWRPYYYGRWVAYPRYGWTWIGLDPWSWPTHHYGRWGHRGGVWFWIPGRIWAPAWVAWASATSYVAWSPLGFDNRPVFALSIGFSRSYSSWTCVPSTRFGHAWRADRYAIAPQRLPAASAFVARRDPPVAVPRFATRAAAVPRNAPDRRTGAFAATPPASDAAAAPRASAAPRAVPRGSTRAPAAVPDSGAVQPPVVERGRRAAPSQGVAPRSRAMPGGNTAAAASTGARSRATPRGQTGATAAAPAQPATPPVVSRAPRGSTPPERTGGQAPAASRAPAARGRWSPQVEPQRTAPQTSPDRSAPASQATPPRSSAGAVGRRSTPSGSAQRNAPSGGAGRAAPSSGARQREPSAGAQRSAPPAGVQRSGPSGGGQRSAPPAGGQRSGPSSGARRPPSAPAARSRGGSSGGSSSSGASGSSQSSGGSSSGSSSSSSGGRRARQR